MKLPTTRDGMLIRDEMLAQYNLHIDHTGGGCLALGYYPPDNPPDPEGYYLWITVNGCELPTDTDDVCEFGVYEPTGDVNWIIQGTDTFMNIYTQRDALLKLARHLHSIGIGELTFNSENGVTRALEAYTLDEPATWLELAAKAVAGTRVRFCAAWDIYPECVVPAGTMATVKETGLNEIWGGLLVLPDDPKIREALKLWDGCIQLGYNEGLDPATDDPSTDEAWQAASPIAIVEEGVR